MSRSDFPDRDRDYRDPVEREVDREFVREPVREPLREPVRERIETREIIREPIVRETRGGGAAFGAGALIVLLLIAVGGFLWWNSQHANPNGYGANPASQPADLGTTPSAPYGTDNNATSPTNTDLTDQTAGGYGIAVGSYPDEQSAVNERQRLNSLTDQPVTMSQSVDNGVTNYQVVIGNFATRAQADSAARTLASSTSLANWRVVPIR